MGMGATGGEDPRIAWEGHQGARAAAERDAGPGADRKTWPAGVSQSPALALSDLCNELISGTALSAGWGFCMDPEAWASSPSAGLATTLLNVDLPATETNTAPDTVPSFAVTNGSYQTNQWS